MNITDIHDRALEWARVNIPDVYHYSSKADWYRSAVNAGIITEEEYRFAHRQWGDMFDYTGD